MTTAGTLTPSAPPAGAGGTSGRRVRRLAVLLGACLLVVVVASVLVGSTWISPLAILDPAHPGHDVASARLARTLVGLAVGGALALSGALMQGLTRNPLADPGIIGTNAGASFAMVLALSVFGVSELHTFVWFSFAGAAVAMLLVHLVASLGRDGATPATLAIAGAALTAAVTSWTAGVLLTDRQTMDVYRYWQVGTIGGRGYDVLAVGLPFVVLGVVLALASARMLDAMALGDDVARQLGRRVGRDRVVVGVAIVLLAGTATALAGPIAFVGLVVAHGVRAVVGPHHRVLLPLTLGFGGVLVVLADVVGRVVLPPTEVQVGIMTAVIGVPFLLWLLKHGRVGVL